jgi:hypothetical protein
MRPFVLQPPYRLLWALLHNLRHSAHVLGVQVSRKVRKIGLLGAEIEETRKAVDGLDQMSRRLMHSSRDCWMSVPPTKTTSAMSMIYRRDRSDLILPVRTSLMLPHARFYAPASLDDTIHATASL